MKQISRSYRVIRSSRKTVAIQIRTDGQVEVRCPRQMSEDAVRAFVQSKSDWIKKHLAKTHAIPQLPALTEKELQVLVQRAQKIIPERAAQFAPLVGVSYGRITIRKQRSLWGSCSGKGNLNFNCLLMQMPPEVLDYVIVHELCHRKEMNHSPGFWEEVQRVMPDYKARKKWLKENGAAIISRMEKGSQKL